NPSTSPDPTLNTTDGGLMYMYDSTISFWIYGQRAPIVRTDTSVKVVPIGTKIDPAYHEWPDVNGDPLASVDNRGGSPSYCTCGAGHTKTNPSVDGMQYPCYFRSGRTE